MKYYILLILYEIQYINSSPNNRNPHHQNGSSLSMAVLAGRCCPSPGLPLHAVLRAMQGWSAIGAIKANIPAAKQRQG